MVDSPAAREDGERARPADGVAADPRGAEAGAPAGIAVPSIASDAGAGTAEGIAGSFTRVPLSSLRIETYTDFTLYLRLRNTDRYVLYRKANLLFTERHRDKLRDNGIRDIYIADADRARYFRYLETRLDDIVSDETLPQKEASRLVYECTSSLVCEVIAKPWLKDNVKRARGLVSSTVRHLLQGPERLRAMVSIMSSDYYTYTHCVNVCVYGLALGQRLGMSAGELHDLGFGLLLHDVGKSQIDPAILNKPAELTPEEWVVMQTHPTRGLEIMKSHDGLPAGTLCAIGQHHEKCSGKGYPRGLAGREIHIFAKIASLADVFDALTTNRPYRCALASFPALRTMQSEMREDFHPLLFQEMIHLLGSREEPVRVPAEFTPARRMASAA